MISKEQVVAAARSWLGTPFIHQARLKGVGVDCAGLIIGVAKELGISEFDVADYTLNPNPSVMLAYLNEHLDVVDRAKIREGDILLFRVEVDPQHLAIVTETYPRMMMVHAYSLTKVGKCVEHGLGEYWTKRLVGCYRYKGVVA